MADNAGGGARPDRPQLIRLALKLPYSDLALSDKGGGAAELNDSEFLLAVVLPYGIGPNEPRLFTVDDAGRLQVTLAGAGPTGGLVNLALDNLAGHQLSSAGLTGDAADGLHLAMVLAGLWNGASHDRSRSASAVNLAAQSGLGAQVVAQPGMWSAVSNPAAGSQATATRAAGGAGVRHVASGLLITFGAIAAPAATALTWALRDGVSGAGAILAQGQVAVPAVPFQSDPIYIGPLAIPGTAATAMTLEFSAALANLLEGVTLLGFDAS